MTIPKGDKALSASEHKRLLELLEITPLSEMASAMIDYQDQLVKGGFKKYQAFALTMQLHECLCDAVFEKTP